MSNSKQPDQGKIAALQSHGILNPFPQKVRNNLFQDNEFFDPKDIIQIKYEMLRRVQMDKKSVSNTVNDFGFSRLSFYRILNSFEKFGFSGLMPKKRGPQKAHKLTVEVLEFVNEIIKENPSQSSALLGQAIKKKFGISIHERSIERALSKGKKRGNNQ